MEGPDIASIEPLSALLQEPVQMFGLNAVEPLQLPFHLIPKGFCPVDMVSVFYKPPGMVDPVVMELPDV